MTMAGVGILKIVEIAWRHLWTINNNKFGIGLKMLVKGDYRIYSRISRPAYKSKSIYFAQKVSKIPNFKNIKYHFSLV